MKMIEVNETTRATFDEITAHPFFSELDFDKVLHREYQGTSTLPIIVREFLPTYCAQSQFLRSRASCPAGTRPWIRIGSRSTLRADKDLCLKTTWNTTKRELHVSHRMRTGGLCRTILSGSWVMRYDSPRERRVRRPLELNALFNPRWSEAAEQG